MESLESSSIIGLSGTKSNLFRFWWFYLSLYDKNTKGKGKTEITYGANIMPVFFSSRIFFFFVT